MEINRVLTRNIVTSIDEMMELVKKQEIVICIKGSAYEEIKNKIKKQKTNSKVNKVLHAVLWGASVFSGGWLFWVLFGAGSIAYHNGRDNLKLYELQDHENYRCFDLVRVKGKNAFNPKFDRIAELTDMDIKVDSKSERENWNKTSEADDIVSCHWNEIIAILQNEYEVSDVSIESWIMPMEVKKIENNIVYVQVPFSSSIDFITKRFTLPLEQAIYKTTDISYQVKFEE